MYARNVTERNLQDIAAGVGFEAKTETVRDNYIKFTLTNKSDSYHVVNEGFGSRRVMRTKVCYHGHYLFFLSLFDVFPKAVVDTGYYRKTRYTVETFEEEAERVGDTVIRQWDGLQVRDKCDCDAYAENDMEVTYNANA